MGVIQSYVSNFFGPTNPYYASLGQDADVVDPKTGLTPRNIADIKYSWDPVKANMKHHGSGFFLLFFKRFPESQNKFKAFRGIPLSDLKESKRLAAHGATVMSAIDSYIVNLDDVDCVVEMLQTTGVNHKTRGVTAPDFKTIPAVFVEYLRNELMPCNMWSPELEEAWLRVINLVVTVIISKL